MFSNIDVRVKLRFYLHCIVKYKHTPDGLVFSLVQGSRGEKQLSIVSHMYSVSERGAITLVQGTVSQQIVSVSKHCAAVFNNWRRGAQGRGLVNPIYFLRTVSGQV